MDGVRKEAGSLCDWGKVLPCVLLIIKICSEAPLMHGGIMLWALIELLIMPRNI